MKAATIVEGSKPADVWALGATLLHLLTGRPPWHGAPNIGAVARRISQEHPEIPADIAPAVAEFLRGCFRRAPRDRPSAEECKQTLQQLAGECGASCSDFRGLSTVQQPKQLVAEVGEGGKEDRQRGGLELP